MMDADQNIESDVFRKADFGLRISEKISTISKDLAVVTKLRTLKNISANSAIDETLFEDSDREVLVKLAVKLTNRLTDVKVLLNDSRSVLEGIETAPVSAPSPQISSQMTDLQVKLDEFKAYTPPPPVIDYALLASQLPKELSRSSAMNSQYSEKQEKELAEIEARSRNIMIYNCVITNKEYSAKEAASHYLFGSTIPSFMNAWQKVKDAKFVKVAEDGKTGTVCATMTSPLVVNTILKDAKLLKDRTSKDYEWPDDDEDATYQWSSSFITIDRTLAQQEERRKLVEEQKKQIASEPGKKWIINRFNRVISVGDFKVK